MQTLKKISRKMILAMWPESVFFVLKNRHLKHSFDVVHWKTNDPCSSCTQWRL